MELKGKVRSGFGEAASWVKKAQKVFKEKYNMDLFLGTLNIELENDFILTTNELIKPNEYGGEYDVLVKKCLIFGQEAYILRPKKNNFKGGDHPLNIIEVVSNINFRKMYNLKDEDVIMLEIEE